ncbi:protein FAN-like [Cylas formicarius]|uniref:protein FAN-like n=1 Tax=Cylas formicarius TaxID=197179 RepID=UPI0029584A8E|nr:protein FAN-like [Cylas formicarius]
MRIFYSIFNLKVLLFDTNMEKGRFSLLLLEPGEIYFEDFSVILIPSDTTCKNYDCKKQEGRLKMCSKSLVFDPRDITKAIIKIPLKECVVIEQFKGLAKFITSKNVLNVNCKEYLEMLEGNIIAPYKFKGSANFLFLLNYASISDCLHQISQLCRACTLPPGEQADMIAAIVHSRQSRVSFDPLWLDLYEKVVIELQANKICPLVINPGRIVLSTMRLYFQPYNNVEMCPVVKIDLNAVRQIVKRRFLLRHIGLEVYCNENSSNSHIYLSFRNQTDRDNFFATIMDQPELRLNRLEQDVITLQWQNGIISNFDYLLYINSLGDRTVNDLTQYPVFPWVLSNYLSDKLDLSDPLNYRDLSKPVGALNPDRLRRLMERYHEMPHPKFIYGSHYSTPGFVLYYLARLYPHYVLCLQSGRFDHPDRMFNSVADAYKNCVSNMSDFKELIPEFYDVSTGGTFLTNSLGIDFGRRHNDVKVGDVELPPWADGPAHFVETLRDALESDVVSDGLHRWIDLIFGYRQQGEEAVNSNNVFYHLCYEGNVDLEGVRDLNRRHALEVQIMEFGQIPKQVFKVPHPKRKIGPPILTEPYEIGDPTAGAAGRWRRARGLELYASFNSHKGAVNFLFVSEDGERVTSVGHDAKLKIFSIAQKKQTRSASVGTAPLSSCVPMLDVGVLAIGTWDNQILFYDLDYGKVTDNILAHEDAITCMTFGASARLLASGSSDCTVKIWRGSNGRGFLKSFRTLDHNSQVTCFCFDAEDKHLAVGTQDGEIYVWETDRFDTFERHDVSASKINALVYGPDGQKLAVGARDGTFKILEVNTGMSVLSKSLASPVTALCWRENLLALGCEDGTLHVWDMFEVRLLLDAAAHSGSVNTVEISRDGDVIATGSADRIVKIWKAEGAVFDR